MKILVSGSQGLIGSALVAFLKDRRHQVMSLVRRSPHADEIHWDPEKALIDEKKLEGVDAVVHLAGENIASGRWSPGKKQRIWNSRVQGTRLISDALAKMAAPPRVFAIASAVGFYGDRGDALLNEDSTQGSGFLAELCREWEEASGSAEEKGIRVLRLRIGVVLSRYGGVLAKILPVFGMGLGGPLGQGRQYMSWIDIDDVVGAIHFLLQREECRGVVNLVAPNPLTNDDFTKVLGKVLRRPTILPVPAFVLRSVLGEMADQLLLASTRVEPSRLSLAGYSFHYSELKNSLSHILNK